MRPGQRSKTVSRHHILPPIVYTPAPPKPKETKRRRGVGFVQGKGDTDETEETSEAASTTPTRSAAVLPQHSAPVEATERRVPSTTANLSEDTLKAMLEAQEQLCRSSSGGNSVPPRTDAG
jgi:hypothetical protein